MKKIIFAAFVAFTSMSAIAGPLSCTFKAADFGSTVNFCTARDVTKIGTTLYIKDGAGKNQTVGDAAGSLWSKFLNWPSRTSRYVKFGNDDRYINVSVLDRTGCIGTQSYMQFPGDLYPTYYSDQCKFSNDVNLAAYM